MDQATFKRQTEEIYREIGRFIVEFSQLVHTMEQHATFTLGPPRTTRAKAKAGPDEAERTLARYRQALNVLFGKGTKTEADRKALGELHRELQALIEERNRVAQTPGSSVGEIKKLPTGAKPNAGATAPARRDRSSPQRLLHGISGSSPGRQTGYVASSATYGARSRRNGRTHRGSRTSCGSPTNDWKRVGLRHETRQSAR